MKRTSIIVTAVIIALGIYDLAVVATSGEESSISRFMQSAGFSSPFIVFVIGYICGHFWGFMPPVCSVCKESLNGSGPCDAGTSLPSVRKDGVVFGQRQRRADRLHED